MLYRNSITARFSMDNKKELLPVVDESGNIVGKVERGIAHNGSKILHPVVHLHVFSPEGYIYLQKRPDWKDVQPGKWDTAVGGHIDYGEDVSEALKREIYEELGINQCKIEKLGYYVFESEIEKELVYVNKTVYSGIIRPDIHELNGGKFWKREEILDCIGKCIFTPNFEHEYLKFFAANNS